MDKKGYKEVLRAVRPHVLERQHIQPSEKQVEDSGSVRFITISLKPYAAPVSLILNALTEEGLLYHDGVSNVGYQSRKEPLLKLVEGASSPDFLTFEDLCD